jgi:hypothetical protein
MNGCPMERDVVQAAANDAWPDALRSHITTCEECAAAAAVSGWMQSFAETDLRDRRLPDPSVLWLKAHLLRSSAAVERASRPITNLQIGAYLLLAAGWAALLTTKWSAIQTWMHGFTPAAIVSKAAGASMSTSISAPLILTVIVLASLTVTVALHTILAEE